MKPSIDYYVIEALDPNQRQHDFLDLIETLLLFDHLVNSIDVAALLPAALSALTPDIRTTEIRLPARQPGPLQEGGKVCRSLAESSQWRHS